MTSAHLSEPRAGMSSSEIRASASLASIFALRMLGMFLILPVFAVHARSLPGGNDASLVGLAMGIYGLTQSFMLPPVFVAERRGKSKQVFIGAIALMLLVQVGLWFYMSHLALPWTSLVVLLFAFFVAFNTLEACQPSMVSASHTLQPRARRWASTTTCKPWACSAAAHWEACCSRTWVHRRSLSSALA